MSEGTLILQGQAVAFFAFDVGYEVSLDKVRSLLASFPAQPLSRKKKTPNYLQYKITPQVVFLGESDVLPGISAQIQATIFDFGAISVAYRWPLAAQADGGSRPLRLDELPAFSAALYERDLEAHARGWVEDMVAKIRPAIVRPDLSELVEDYYVFILEQLDQPLSADELLARHAAVLSQTLRFDTEPLSLEQQTDALNKRISYYERDLALIDWNTAIVYDSEYLDTVNVLELSNVELLEARYIDAQLDVRIDEYEPLVQQSNAWYVPLYTPYRQIRTDLAELRIESSLLAERVDNSLKLIGDLYLARVHTAATERFNMTEWETAIARKLDIVGNFYQLLTDRVSTSQAQALELVIIILILIEILLGLLR